MPILDYTDERNRIALWRWQAAQGFGPVAGSRPIDWYQVEHAAISDALARMARQWIMKTSPLVPKGSAVEVRRRANWIEMRPVGSGWKVWATLAEVGELMRLARNGERR